MAAVKRCVKLMNRWPTRSKSIGKSISKMSWGPVLLFPFSSLLQVAFLSMLAKKTLPSRSRASRSLLSNLLFRHHRAQLLCLFSKATSEAPKRLQLCRCVPLTGGMWIPLWTMRKGDAGNRLGRVFEGLESMSLPRHHQSSTLDVTESLF